MKREVRADGVAIRGEVEQGGRLVEQTATVQAKMESTTIQET